MIKLWKHILPLIAAVIFASCSSNEAEVIPRGKMAEIYAEILMTDQWISSTSGMRMIADTSLVYEPILEKYGYDKIDYIHSVDYYMNDPERFSRIFRSSSEILDKKLKDLHKIQRKQELDAAAAKKLKKFVTDHAFEEYFPYLSLEPYVHYHDSIKVEQDDMSVYRLIPVETADTVYDGLNMIINRVDTLKVDSLKTDSLVIIDSEKVQNLLPVRDSVLNRKSIKNIQPWPKKE
jgi:hypothetical protein